MTVVTADFEEKKNTSYQAQGTSACSLFPIMPTNPSIGFS